MTMLSPGNDLPSQAFSSRYFPRRHPKQAAGFNDETRLVFYSARPDASRPSKREAEHLRIHNSGTA